MDRVLIKIYLLIFFVFVELLLSGCGGGNNNDGEQSVIYNPVIFTNNQTAAVVIGQTDFVTAKKGATASSLDGPYTNTFVYNDILYVSDFGNNRIVGFNNIPTTNNTSADFVLGQSDFTTGTQNTSVNGFDGPQSPMIVDGRLFVSENLNNRISIYNTIPTISTASKSTIDVVLGQQNKISASSGCSRTQLHYPESVWVSGNKIIVADYFNNRVLIWNSIPSVDGQAADIVLGQEDFTSCLANGNRKSVSDDTLDSPTGVWSDGKRLVILDSGNHRILIWNNFPTVNKTPANLVLGQENFRSNFLNRKNTTPDASTLNKPFEGIYVANNQLFVTDSGNNRILIWNSFPTSNGVAADVVIGQVDFNSLVSGTDANMLNFPVGLSLLNNDLIVTDNKNNRLLIFNGN